MEGGQDWVVVNDYNLSAWEFYFNLLPHQTCIISGMNVCIALFLLYLRNCHHLIQEIKIAFCIIAQWH